MRSRSDILIGAMALPSIERRFGVITNADSCDFMRAQDRRHGAADNRGVRQRKAPRVNSAHVESAPS
jgi:hypothetical protein